MSDAASNHQDPEMARDIEFFADLTKREIEQIKRQFESALAAENAGAVGLVADELAQQLGRLSARLRLIEEAVELHLLQSPGAPVAPVQAQPVSAYYSDPEYISRHFSLMMYIENIFRNRPGITKFIGSIHRFFSRLLKLP